MVDDTYGWKVEDLDTELHAGTLWIDTDNEELIKKIIMRYEPEEYDLRDITLSPFLKDKTSKWRLWWD